MFLILVRHILLLSQNLLPISLNFSYHKFIYRISLKTFWLKNLFGAQRLILLSIFFGGFSGFQSFDIDFILLTLLQLPLIIEVLTCYLFIILNNFYACLWFRHEPSFHVILYASYVCFSTISPLSTWVAKGR
jgi:hypothetical protein